MFSGRQTDSIFKLHGINDQPDSTALAKIVGFAAVFARSGFQFKHGLLRGLGMAGLDFTQMSRWIWKQLPMPL